MLSIFEMAQRKFHPTQENQHQMKKEREKDIRSKKKNKSILKGRSVIQTLRSCDGERFSTRSNDKSNRSVK